MRFKLEKESVQGNTCNNKHVANVKVDSETTFSLPTTFYAFAHDKRSPLLYSFIIYETHHDITKSLNVFVDQEIQLELGKVGNDYKLALVDSLGNPYYHYYYETRYQTYSNDIIYSIVSIPEDKIRGKYVQIYDYEKCGVGLKLLSDSRVLIDPKDIISSKDISSILTNTKLIIKAEGIFQIKDSFISYLSANVYDFTGEKVGTLNNVGCHFDRGGNLFHLSPYEHLNHSYFATEKLGANYVGCISDENGKCKNFYPLNPNSFGYKYDHDSDLYPYYYNLENFGNFLEVDMKRREYMDLEARITYLEGKIEELKSAGINGSPGLPGKKGEPGIKGDRGSSCTNGQKGDIGPKGEYGVQGIDGLPGIKGDQGLQGEKGEPGIQGIFGLQGLVGPKGDQGIPGPIGPKGDQGGIGPQGNKGEQGIQGFNGTQGEKGGVGLPGMHGPHGLAGPKGDMGNKGETGVPGIPGPQGLVGQRGLNGVQGEKGDKGIQGKKGDQGLIGFGRQGRSGNPGLQGLKGEQGDIGLIGPKGLNGIKGNKGNVGSPGTPGEKGDRGDKGTVGPKGKDGTPGTDGLLGMPGPQGVPGIDGLKGEIGSQGLKGDQGDKGDVGLPGAKGNQGSTGPQGLSGEEGAQGTQGLKGERGDRGEIGLPGMDGAPGIPGEKGNKGMDANPKEIAQKLINNGTIANEVLEYRNQNGDLVLKQQITGILIYDQDIQAGIATALIDNRAQELKEALLSDDNNTLVKNLANSTELTGSVSEELRKNPGKVQGPKGDKGDTGALGMPGLQGPKGNMGNQGLHGQKGELGIDGLKGNTGSKGNKGSVGPVGLKGEDGVGAAVADQFLREMNQTKLEIQDAQKAAEIAKTASEKSAKEALYAEDKVTKLHDKIANLTKRAETFKNQAVQSQRSTEALRQDTREFHSKTKDIFCKTKPTDQVCTVRRKKRETPPVTSGASRPIPFISQVMNFFYPSVEQDEYKLKNKIQELDQAAKIIDAADVVTKFERVLEETASKCGIPKKSLNFNPVKLQSTIINKSLFNDGNRNELLKFLYVAAKKSFSHYKQIDKCLATFKDHMEKTLKTNEQQRDFVNTEKIVADSEQPRSFMSDVAPPSTFNAINQEVFGYLR